MRKYWTILALAVGMTCVAWAVAQKTVTLAVQNMTCSMCPITVKNALEKVPGVSAVHVDFDKKTATVTYDPAKIQPDRLTRATTNAGYPSTVEKSDQK